MNVKERLRLDWQNYRSSMTTSLKSLVQDEEFVDVTLHTEGRMLKAHRVYLSACSDYFRKVLKGTLQWQQPILFLAQIPFEDLVKILEFVYHGSVEITRSSLSSFLKSASLLQIHGLEEKCYEMTTNVLDDDCGQINNTVTHPKTKKRKIESKETNENICDIKEEIGEQDQEDLSEQVVVKADPEDFQEHDGVEDDPIDGEVSSRGIVIRSDLLNSGKESDNDEQMYGERGRCHFCSLLCPGRPALTEHLKSVHQPPKHSLCENCENFFHICAIQRHRLKCKARYQTER